MTIRGGCRCGAVSYTLAIDVAPAIYACHCLNCQKWSGSAFAEHALVSEDAVTVIGPVIFHEHEAAGSHTSCQRVCGICHTRIYNTTTAAPGMVVLRAGTLVDSQRLVPFAHIWTKRKQSWVFIPDNVPSWTESPSLEEFTSALRTMRSDV